ncbi:biopolymer transporter ExbD [Betaproteobacteria bacterium]|nr:biopolymer transporter ExbD [Betaproteobacteria bacterium]GHU02096.1 biopolymer transporter ExbD [Betaproteobacteria bacterium]
MAFHPQLHSQSLQGEINMIPLIDVMLVLLIIFIVAAPLLTHAVLIDLPKASSAPLELKAGTIQLGIKADGRIYWNGEETSAAALEDLLQSAARHTPQPELHLQADATTPYEVLARIMAQSARHGLGRIGFVSEPENEEKP